MKRISCLLLLALVVSMFSSCGVYKLNGASISKDLKTVSVQYFENNAPLVVPNLSQLFTEALKDRIRTQTSLSFVRNDAQATFEGRITGYDIKPIAIQDLNRPVAGQTRLSITVSVKYTDNTNAKNNYEQSFTRYKDFQFNGGSMQPIEQGLIIEINKMLTEDIFNRAFANW